MTQTTGSPEKSGRFNIENEFKVDISPQKVRIAKLVGNELIKSSLVYAKLDNAFFMRTSLKDLFFSVHGGIMVNNASQPTPKSGAAKLKRYA